MGWKRSLFSLLLVLITSGCAWFQSGEDETKDWNASRLYSAASAAMDEGDYKEAIDYLEKLESRYPFGRYAQQALLDMAYAYYKLEEPDSAIASAERFIKLYPQNPYVDYAYYLKGIVNYNRSAGFLERYVPADPSQRDPGSAMDAFKDFDELIRRYPESRYAEDARLRMLFLRNNLAKYEIHVANYYMKRGAFLAAANRANYVIQRYQRTTAVADALRILIAAYTELGLTELAADSRRVLDLNLAKGTLVTEEPKPEEVSLARKTWEYLGLDQN